LVKEEATIPVGIATKPKPINTMKVENILPPAVMG
jgi:hypothetical protein